MHARKHQKLFNPKEAWSLTPASVQAKENHEQEGAAPVIETEVLKISWSNIPVGPERVVGPQNKRPHMLTLVAGTTLDSQID